MNMNMNIEEFENEELDIASIYNDFIHKLQNNSISISRKDIEKLLLAIHDSNEKQR